MAIAEIKPNTNNASILILFFVPNKPKAYAEC